jgi:hypothetical protein
VRKRQGQSALFGSDAGVDGGLGGANSIPAPLPRHSSRQNISEGNTNSDLSVGRPVQVDRCARHNVTVPASIGTASQSPVSSLTSGRRLPLSSAPAPLGNLPYRPLPLPRELLHLPLAPGRGPSSTSIDGDVRLPRLETVPLFLARKIRSGVGKWGRDQRARPQSAAKEIRKRHLDSTILEKGARSK